MIAEEETPPGLTLEAELVPARAAALLRGAPGRVAACRILWLDEPGEALSRRGWLIERSGGTERPVPLSDEAGTPPEPSETPLSPVAGLTGRRREAVLPGPEGEVRVLLTAGRLRAAAGEAAVARATISGPGPAVLALLGAWSAGTAAATPTRSRLPLAALALARGTPPRPPRPRSAALDPGGTVGDAIAAVLRQGAEHLLHHAPEARPGAGPEPVHACRVTLRRLRSALRALRPASEHPALRELEQRLRSLAALLGEARDLDVFLGGIAAEAAAATETAREGGQDPRLAGLFRAAEARRRAAYAALRGELDGPGFRGLLWSLLGAAHARPWETAPGAGRPLREHAAALLDAQWRRLRKRGRGIASADPGALHELRLTGKRARYAAELFAPLWSGRCAKRLLRRLAALQEALGLANDAAVAAALAESLAGRDPGGRWAAGFVEGWARARARRSRRRATRAWEALESASPFWHAGPA